MRIFAVAQIGTFDVCQLATWRLIVASNSVVGQLDVFVANGTRAPLALRSVKNEATTSNVSPPLHQDLAQAAGFVAAFLQSYILNKAKKLFFFKKTA